MNVLAIQFIVFAALVMLTTALCAWATYRRLERQFQERIWDCVSKMSDEELDALVREMEQVGRDNHP